MSDEYLPTEHQEQVTLVAFLELMVASKKILAFTAIPQNMWTRSIQQKMKAKREGVRKGFPDLVIVTGKEVIFLEMKRKKKGRVRPEQQIWLDILDNKKTRSNVCYGSDEAIDYLGSLLKMR